MRRSLFTFLHKKITNFKTKFIFQPLQIFFCRNILQKYHSKNNKITLTAFVNKRVRHPIQQIFKIDIAVNEAIFCLKNPYSSHVMSILYDEVYGNCSYAIGVTSCCYYSNKRLPSNYLI